MIFFPGDNETIIGVDIEDEKTKSDILSGVKTTYNLVLTPKMLLLRQINNLAYFNL